MKNTAAWKETRSEYIVKLKQRLARDPEFAAIFRAESNARLRAWRKRIRKTDESRYAEMKAAAREERAAWRRKLESDPVAWEAHKRKCRAWYAALSPEDRDRIFNVPRRRKMGRPPIYWPPWALDALGKSLDKEIASKLGVHPYSVQLKRESLGIAAVSKQSRARAAHLSERSRLLVRARAAVREVAELEKSSFDETLNRLLSKH